jgi:hypothetical protein
MAVFLLLVLIVGIIYFLFFTEPGKAFLKQIQDSNAARAAQNKAIKDTWQAKILQLEDSRDPQTARELLEEFKGVSYPGAVLGRDTCQKTIRIISSICIREPDVIDYITSQITKNKYISFLSAPKVEPYNLALRVLDENPKEPRAKKFVLEVGRWNFGKLREVKAATIYDEQSIHNDIKVREQI